jgi:hypothetical protein
MKLETSNNLNTVPNYSTRSKSTFTTQFVTHTAQVPVSSGLFYREDLIWAPNVDAFSIFALPKPLSVPLESSVFASALAIQYEGFFTPATVDINTWPLYLTIGEIRSGTGSLFEPLITWELQELHFNRTSGVFSHTVKELETKPFDWSIDRALGVCVCYDGSLKTFAENEDITNGEVKASITIGQITKGLI